MNEVFSKREEAALDLERNPVLVKSITSFPYMIWNSYQTVCFTVTSINLTESLSRLGAQPRLLRFKNGLRLAAALCVPIFLKPRLRDLLPQGRLGDRLRITSL
jgi:hypothetical protein